MHIKLHHTFQTDEEVEINGAPHDVRVERGRDGDDNRTFTIRDLRSGGLRGVLTIDAATWAGIEREIIERHIARVKAHEPRAIDVPRQVPEVGAVPQVPRFVPAPAALPVMPHRIAVGIEAGAMQFTALQAGREHTTIATYAAHGVTLLHPPGDYVTIEFNGSGETLAKLKLPVHTWEHLKKVGYDQDRAKFDLPVPEDFPIRFTVGETIGTGKTIGVQQPDVVETLYPSSGNGVELVFSTEGKVTARLALSRSAYAWVQLAACRWLADDVRNIVNDVMGTMEKNTEVEPKRPGRSESPF